MTELIDIQALLDALRGYLPTLGQAALILFLFWLFYRILRRPAHAMLRRAEIQPTLVRLLVDSILRFTMLVLGVIMAADQLGFNVAAALAGLGVAGIAVGFAAQDSLANIIAGFIVFWDKPFLVGDWVTVQDQYGRVEDITLRSTRIRTPRNIYVVIPNKQIIDDLLVNHSKNGETRVDLAVSIAYKEDILAARRVLLAAVDAMAGLLADPAPEVVVTKLDDSSVNLSLRVWIARADEEAPISVQVLEAAKLALDAAGIQIPFPHLQLFVDEVKAPVWREAAALRDGRSGA